ncbi:hypothetical protein PLICRDRAFT_453615 [Plicaturopsis crispa FD-325 SS-3]|uniref:Uncharacterized protein n=1 Tax=Plicaturopsis crispa FD-325 SS-3 TaxID=944288 RepID=A0A0C9SVW4_PLICR|nr:hypothetical protein PLICRDRAFT_453615 [Plicaturopsis crispa FD-325 SS-3]
MSPLASDGAGTAFTSFSTIISVISALIGILGCLYATLFCCSHLPDARIRRLDELLRETEVYCRAREDKDLQAELSVIRREACGLRYRAHRAVAHWQQWAEFFKGLSFEIEYSCYKARALRARMIDLLQGENGIVIDVHDGVELNDLPRKTISWPAPDKGVRSMQTARPMSDRAGQLQLRWWTRMGASRTADAYLHSEPYADSAKRS